MFFNCALHVSQRRCIVTGPFRSDVFDSSRAEVVGTTADAHCGCETSFSQGLVQHVFNTATKDCDSPDVRDRAYMYRRLISTDPGAAKVCIRMIRFHGHLDFSFMLLRSLSSSRIGHRRYPCFAPLLRLRYSMSLIEEISSFFKSLVPETFSNIHRPRTGRRRVTSMQYRGDCQ